MSEQTTTERQGPPEIMYKVVNPIVKAILRSPLHRLFSKMLMVLTFTGRKSGRPYTIPVGYQVESVPAGDTLIVFSHHNWWKNLRGGKPVTVRVQGKRYEGIATPRTDEEAVLQRVRTFVERHGAENLRRLGMTLDGEPTDEALRRAAAGSVIIEVALDEKVS